ncbi:ERF family protein [Burkholderia lata]|uniref:ERF family protein n=1 Tax=Burkholderia lata (strain ATCC 17760 / DSM 23089 / LMG 22485 / NCIMB 9086 / R18194 / 383) TaxID=482957 RepID=A0A6P2GY74_BURL3|nr:ERF family protein [Burkholderia lata]VWB08324.1 ERF family protein [Burkholderia lata]
METVQTLVTSESIAKFAPAFLQAQKTIEFAKKESRNDHFKNSYADLSSVVDAVKPALNEAGIAYIQAPVPSDDGKLHMTTRLLHESGEWMEGTLVMPLPKQDPQGYGSAMTYARRYALAAITGLYQDDDDGNLGSGVNGRNDKQSGGNRSINKQSAANPEDPADMATIEQMNSAASVPDLVAIMNGLTKDQKAAVNATFNQRMKELKKAA